MHMCPSDRSYGPCVAECAKRCIQPSQALASNGATVRPFNHCSLTDDRCAEGYACARVSVRTLCMPMAETIERAGHSPVFMNMLRHAVGAE
jgi:hypothetical protein